MKKLIMTLLVSCIVLSFTLFKTDCEAFAESTYQGDTDINVDIIPLTVNISVPLRVYCRIIPDQETVFTNDLLVYNKTKAPVILTIKEFKPSGEGLTLFNGTTDRLDYDARLMNMEQSKKKLALGISPFDENHSYSDGWDSVSVTDELWCGFTNNVVLGKVKERSYVKLSLDVLSGMAFKEPYAWEPFQVCFIAEIE